MNERIDENHVRPGRATGRPRGIRWAVLAAILASACGGANTPESTTPDRPGNLADREPCIADDADEDDDVDIRDGDADGDGTPEIRHLFRDDVRVCSEYDMNRDGREDVVRFYDADGETPVREEHDFDFDGRLDLVRHYEGGALVRQELDTDFDHYVDTTLFCEAGRVVRAERDRYRRGETDLWEEYDGGLLAAARYDDDRDGVPEKFEYFEGGRLVALGLDTNGDGEPDEREDVAPDAAARAVEALYCDLPASSPPAPGETSE